jgi:hypothetical protein
MSKQTASRKPSVESQAAVTTLVEQIQARQRQIDENEGGTVANLIRIGALLIQLQAAAGRTWAETAKGLGYHPRAASRLQLLGRSWLADEIGTKGSDLLSRLPADPQKLEWLCRLSRPQLEELLTDLDPKKATRRAVADAVKAMLNLDTPEKAGKDLPTVIARFFKKVASTIRRWQDEAGTGEGRDELHDLLVARLRQVEQQVGLDVPEPQAAGVSND